MELKEFISTALTQIAQGIEEASRNLKGSSAVVCPRAMTSTQSDSRYFGFLPADSEKQDVKKYFRVVQEIEFDVAVVASQGKETQGGIGIMVGSVGIGTKGRSESESTSHSRLRFAIPMVLPCTP